MSRIDLQRETSVARQQHLSGSTKGVCSGRKHGREENTQTKSKRQAGQDAFEVGRLVGRQKLEETVGDERKTQHDPASQPDQRSTIVGVNPVKHGFGQQGKTGVADRPSVPPPPAEHHTTDEETPKDANITGADRKLVVVYFP